MHLSPFLGMIEEKISAHHTFRTLKLIVLSLIAICILGAGTFSRRAEAQMIVNDPPNTIQNSITAANSASQLNKELYLDPLFYGIARIAIQGITDSVVRWINSGFQGSPAFVTDPGQFFTGIADEVAGTFIAGTELGFLCEPFQLDIRAALNFNYSQRYRSSCTLTDVIRNVENFTDFTKGNFSAGGWDGWISMTQNPNNNPYGAYVKAEEELAIRLRTAQGQELQLLQWGNGFLSWKDENGKIQTPGSVIESQLSNVLGSGIDQLELADEFNEIVGALMGQLVQKVLIGGLTNAPSVRSNDYNNNNLTGYCRPDRDEILEGESITWTANIYGATGATTYEWLGNDPLQGLTGQTVTVTYENRGRKSARIRVTSGGESRTIQCLQVVTVRRDRSDNDN